MKRETHVLPDRPGSVAIVSTQSRLFLRVLRAPGRLEGEKIGSVSFPPLPTGLKRCERLRSSSSRGGGRGAWLEEQGREAPMQQQQQGQGCHHFPVRASKHLTHLESAWTPIRVHESHSKAAVPASAHCDSSCAEKLQQAKLGKNFVALLNYSFLSLSLFSGCSLFSARACAHSTFCDCATTDSS